MVMFSTKYIAIFKRYIAGCVKSTWPHQIIKKGYYMKGKFTPSQNICLNLHSVPSVIPLGSTRQERALEKAVYGH